MTPLDWDKVGDLNFLSDMFRIIFVPNQVLTDKEYFKGEEKWNDFNKIKVQDIFISIYCFPKGPWFFCLNCSKSLAHELYYWQKNPWIFNRCWSTVFQTHFWLIGLNLKSILHNIAIDLLKSLIDYRNTRTFSRKLP